MDELRLVRREDQSLVVATEAGEEYRLLVDETMLAEFRHLSRPSRGPGKVNPREVQALVRAGKTREEIALATGLEESDIERYEEPVLAERRYILELARMVPVRTSPSDEAEQDFGTVIAERLIGLRASGADWSSWRDEEAGWMIGLEFDSHEVAHRAVWSFDHRKGLLTPITADATTLSKQGDVGDRLIPKLRAVDANERFDSGAFDVDSLHLEADDEKSGESGLGAARDRGDDSGAKDPAARTAPKVAPDHPSTGSIPVVDAGEEFARRQHIEERAIKTPERELPDLGQTADLLDALRRRRGEREAANNEAPSKPPLPIPIGGRNDEADGPHHDAEPESHWELVDDETADTEEVEGLRDPDETRVVPPSGPRLVPGLFDEESSPQGAERDPREPGADDTEAEGSEKSRSEKKHAAKDESDSRKRGRGRASIPSWDDILFGTRSEDDPA